MAIFGATSSKKARVFQSGSARATIGASPAILLGVEIQVTRQMSPVPTLTDGIVWAAQPVQGVLSAQSIVVAGESLGLVSSLTDRGLCKPIACTIQMTDGACDSAGVALTIKDGYCSAVTFSASGGQGYIANNFTIQFTNAEYVG